MSGISEHELELVEALVDHGQPHLNTAYLPADLLKRLAETVREGWANGKAAPLTEARCRTIAREELAAARLTNSPMRDVHNLMGAEIKAARLAAIEECAALIESYTFEPNPHHVIRRVAAILRALKGKPGA